MSVFLRTISISLLQLTVLSNTFASDYDLSAHMGIGEVFSDNIDLADKNFAGSDFITILSPSFSMKTEGRRFQSNTDYLLQQVIYKNSSGSNLIHTANSSASAEILEDHFFTDFNLKNGQQNISSNGALSLDNLSPNRNRNRENILSYQIEPYWKQNYYDLAEITIGHDFNEVISDTNESTGNTSYINIVNGRGISRLLFDFGISNRFVKSNNSDEIRFTSINNKFTYPFSPQFSFVTEFGYDDNDFLSAQKTSGLTWSVGGIWHPSRNTNFEFGYGERFFGTDINFEGLYISHRGHLRFAFEQTVESARNSLLNQQSFNLTDNFGQPIVNPDTLNPADLNISALDQRDDVVVIDNFIADFSYVYNRNTFSMSLNYTERNFQIGSAGEEIFSTNFRWRRIISRKLSSNMSLVFQNRSSEPNIDTYNYIIDYSMNRKLGKTLGIVFGFRHVLFDTNIGDDYLENRAHISLSKSF